MGKILNTGALGNVGKYVAKHLIKEKQDVVVGDINIDKLKMYYGENVDSRYFDFTIEKNI